MATITVFETVKLTSVKTNGTANLADVLFSFPVPHQQMTIKKGIKTQRDGVKGRSGTSKGNAVYADSEVSMEITLVDDEDKAGAVTSGAIDKLKAIVKAFAGVHMATVKKGSKVVASGGSPKIFGIQSRLTDAAEIKTVIFKDLNIKDTPGETTITVSLSFVEYFPPARKKETAAKTTTTNAVSGAPTGFTSTGLNEYQSVEKFYSDEDTAAKEAFYRDVNMWQAERDKKDAMIGVKIGADGVPYPWNF